MRKDFKNIDIYAAFQPTNGVNGKRLTVSPLTGKHRNTLK
jgi:hypothetical protein